MSLDDILLPNLEQPSLFWRSISHQTILTVAAASRGFLYGLNKTEVHGLPRFLQLLKSRSDHRDRRKGLLTVSNHLCVIDDPLIWGVLPLSFTALHLYNNHRFGFGSHDICFQGTFRSHFFTFGQVLPAHRLAHSPFGGPFQATMTEGVRLFSKISPKSHTFNPFSSSRNNHPASFPHDCIDPFSDLPRDFAPSYPSYPNDIRRYLAPSRYASNSYAWVHVFPEGMIHQSPDYHMRYFKWGFTRLILEPAVCPDIVPIFIEGTDQIMHESRTFPRFLPRIGKNVCVTFGDPVPDGDAMFGDLRKRWNELQDEWLEQEQSKVAGLPWGEAMTGIVPQGFAANEEAKQLRMECARRVRELVLAVRRQRGYPDEDPKASYAQTWAREGPKREGKMKDGTWVGDT